MSAPRWGLLFINCPLRLSEEQKTGLIHLAAEAYFHEKGHIPFDWKTCHGIVRATSETKILGSFVGQEFEANIHLPEKEGVVQFLIAEKLLQSWGGPVAEA